jgi:hypothetical protein
MDINEHTMDRKLRKMIEAKGVRLMEFSHKSWVMFPQTRISMKQTPYMMDTGPRMWQLQSLGYRGVN